MHLHWLLSRIRRQTTSGIWIQQRGILSSSSPKTDVQLAREDDYLPNNYNYKVDLTYSISFCKHINNNAFDLSKSDDPPPQHV